MKLAEAYGLNGYRVSHVDEFEAALAAAKDSDRGTVIDCAINMDEMVRPMVGGGSHITDFLAL